MNDKMKTSTIPDNLYIKQIYLQFTSIRMPTSTAQKVKSALESKCALKKVRVVELTNKIPTIQELEAESVSP